MAERRTTVESEVADGQLVDAAAPSTCVAIWRNAKHGRRIEPLERFGIKVMSTQFLIAENQALSWSAPLIEMLLERFASDIEWGDIDFLLVDLPPGTADVQQQLASRLGLAGALVVVTPQDAAHLDAKKVLTMFEQWSVPVIGGVENMSGVACPCCSAWIELFRPVAPQRSIWAAGVDRLVGIPVDAAVAGDGGRPLMIEQPQSGPANAFRELARRLVSWADDSQSRRRMRALLPVLPDSTPTRAGSSTTA